MEPSDEGTRHQSRLSVLLLHANPRAWDRGCRHRFVEQHNKSCTSGNDLSPGLILVVVVAGMALGALPVWPHSRRWGYAPAGALALMLAVVTGLFLIHRI